MAQGGGVTAGPAFSTAPSADTGHWASLGESTFVLGIWLLFAVHALLGRRVFRVVMAPVVGLHWCLRAPLRAVSLGYLQRLWDRPASWREGYAHVRLFAETMLDKLLAMAGRYPAHQVVQRGADELYQRALQGQGGVLVTAHMGCLELCQTLAQARPGFVLNVLVHTRHAQAFNRILRRLQPHSTVELIEVSELDVGLMTRLAAKVAAGEYLAIAGDRVPLHSGKTTRVDFLGAPADFPIGPYLIAALLDCPLYLMLSLHEGSGYVVEFELLAEKIVLPRREREVVLNAHACAYVAALTARLRRSPYDWFNFYAFWDSAHPHRL